MSAKPAAVGNEATRRRATTGFTFPVSARPSVKSSGVQDDEVT
jgi:hypothetical protein